MLHSDQINFLYISLGKRIREERERAKFKQTNFAELLSISRASLVNIEQGKQRPPLHIIYEIAKLLKVSITDLLPDLDALDKEIDSNIKKQIEEKSGGSEDRQNKLLDFVKANIKSSKS
ncbi:helix-turn-helix transcriptional regulator [Pontibacter rugosus]|uniref:Helix-turn-helix transcriptional regulator n=1 Tax=Pontibacter rugosus TaxID=1745966 RepID=A0ABW3SM62_9BACT